MKIKLLIIFYCFSFCYCFGQTWNRVGNPGLAYPSDVPVVDRMFNYKNKLYVAGSFTQADGMNVLPVVKWDGTKWDTLQTAAYDYIGDKLSEYAGNLVLAGPFDSIPGAGGSYFGICWSDGTDISECASCHTGSSLTTMSEYQGNFYIGGYITNVNGLNINRIGKWNGSSWSNVGGGVTGGFMPRLECMQTYNNELYVGGDFTFAGGKGANYIARWNGVKWDSLQSGVNGGYVQTMIVDSINNFLYVAGAFTKAGGKTVNYIAGWDGKDWFALDTLCAGGFLDLAMYHDELYAAGSFGLNGDNTTAVFLAKWDGIKWTAIPGIPSTLSSLSVYNDELYIGGGFQQINGNSAIKAIARYSAPSPSGCDYLQARIFASDTAFYYAGDSSMVQFQNNNKYASTWQWSFGDGDIANIQNPVHYYTSPGTYTAQVIVNYNGCVDTATKIVVVKDITGIKEITKNNLFKVFPNPAKDEITVRIEAGIKIQDPKIEILDIAGKKVKEVSEIKGNEIKISLEGFRKGVYFVKLISKAGELSVEKILIE